MNPRQREQRARYARRRRAALPSALAAFVALVVATSSNIPASFAGSTVPSLTVVLPPQLVNAPADSGSADTSGGGGGGSDVAARPTPSGRDDTSGQQPTADGGNGGGHRHHKATHATRIRHVFLIVLADTDLTALAADPIPPATRAAPYLARKLAPKGTLLTNYASVARGAVANGVALLSGQGPTAQTLADCPTYADVTPDTVGEDAQQLGDGCVYPFATGTVVDELHGAGLDGRAYVEDLGAGGQDPAHPGAVTCRHPAPGGVDDAAAPRPGDAYVTRRNPLVYFHSLLDTGACARDDLGLDALDADLAAGRDAPALSYIVPDRCHDGSATPCVPGAPAGAGAADAFLATLVPRILASPAYADGGLLVITSDQPPPPPPTSPPPTTPPPTTPTTTPTTTTPAPTTTPQTTTTQAPTTTPRTTTPQTTTTQVLPPPTTSTATAPPPSAAAAAVTPPPRCCQPRTYPNVGDATAAGAGIVGALLIGPGVRAGATDAAPANHFTLLRAIADLFALQPLGYAGASALVPFPDRVLPALAHRSTAP